MIRKPLKLFVNTLTVHEKFPLPKRDNLAKPIQMQLCQKQKAFCECFFVFPKSTLNFENLKKTDDPHS